MLPLIPESPITEYKSTRTGYGQSKLVAEKLLYAATEKTGLNVIVYCVGQIAGPV
jgi:thioester reductase-like protein